MSAALSFVGLDWNIQQKSIETEDGILIPGFKKHIRDVDEKVLGVVTDCYKVVQNTDAFSLTDGSMERYLLIL